MYWTLALAVAGPESGHFWQNRAWLWENFWLYFQGWQMSAQLQYTDYLQLKVTKLVLACHHLSDLTVCCAVAAN